MSHSLAIVEGDEVQARELRARLVHAGFSVRCYATTTAALAGLHSGAYDLCLLDIDLPAVDGVDLCQALRASGVSIPIIAVTSGPQEESRRVEALSAGADDVVPKTISSRELVARVRAVLRRSGRVSAALAYQDEELRVDLDQMRAVVAGRPVALSRGEARVLSILIHEAPAPVPSSRLCRELSPEEDQLKQTTVEARIKSLRRKLGPHRIETRARFGYAFVKRGA
ncbi:MAG TPA: response regulator transcription factor [Thermoanaerobaculia bacterium]|nr:response regulator transcription factor [Thermoanaerobaculia bacterium]